jgi:hypothetical protein
MSQHATLLEAYVKSVCFPDVSGFEILELLRLRSHLAEVEQEFTSTEQSTLEAADATFLHNAPTFYRHLSEVATLETLRKEAHVLPSHWWWYLDSLSRVAVA